MFVEHLPPCENPSQILVHHSVDEEKRFSALRECVHVCVCAVEVYERERREIDRQREQERMTVCLVVFVLEKKPERASVHV